MAAHILLIEDDVDVGDSLQELLAIEGYEVKLCRNGKDGLDYLQAESVPCVILTDFMMPKMNGIEFRNAQLAVPRLASIPTFLLTGASEQGMAQALSKFTGELRKPLRLAEFLCIVEQHCSHKA